MLFSPRVPTIIAATVATFTGLSSFSNSPVLAITAFAQDAYGNVYQCKHSNANTAQRCVISYCQEQSGKRCVIVNPNQNSRPQPTGCINPATGLPMISGTCSGIDVGGNPYGVRLNP